MAKDLIKAIIEKKQGRSYEDKQLEYNFALNKELTVEITLAEYRELIKTNAEICKERSEWNYKMSQKISEIDKIQKENTNLKEQIVKLMECKKEEE